VFSSRRPGSGRTFSLVAVFFIFALVLAPPIQHYFTQRAQINALRAQVDSDRAALKQRAWNSLAGKILIT
jgi:hypothetical protein